MTPEDLRRLGEELGLDAVGVARAEAYEDTERHRIVSLKNRCIAEVTHSIDIKHAFNQERSRQDQSEKMSQSGDNRCKR